MAPSTALDDRVNNGSAAGEYFSFVSRALVAAAVGVALALMLRFVFWPYPLENFEGGCLWAARLWGQGAGLYVADPAVRLPIYNYPPLYVFLLRALILSSAPFVAGRLIGLAAIAGLAAGAAYFVSITTGNRTAATAAAAAVMLTPENLLFGPIVRVDALAASFSLLGLLAGYRWRSSRGGLAGAAAICVAAWFTKQTAVAAPAALALWLATVDRRAAARFAVSYAALLGAGIGVAELAFRGVFLQNVIGFSASSFSLAGFVHQMEKYFTLFWPLRVVPLAGAVGGLLAVRRLGVWATPWPFYLAMCALGLATLGKTGGGLLYFFEFHAACAIGFGLGVNYLLAARPYVARAALATVSALALAAVIIFADRAWRGLDRAGDEAAVRLVRAASGPVLLEDSGYGLLAGTTELDMINPFLSRQLAARGTLDPSPWLEKIHARRYALIMLESPAEDPAPATRARFSPEMLAAIAADYRLAAVAGHGHFYLPRANANESRGSEP